MVLRRSATRRYTGRNGVDPAPAGGGTGEANPPTTPSDQSALAAPVLPGARKRIGREWRPDRSAADVARELPPVGRRYCLVAVVYLAGHR